MKILNCFLAGALALLFSMNGQGQASNVKDDLSRAQTLATQGNIAEASVIYLDLMGKYPGNREVVQGWLILNMKKSPTGEEEAIQQLEELEKKYPENTAILFFKAYIQGEYKHYDDALKTTDRLIAKEPGDGMNWLMKGQILESVNRNDDAMTAYEKATTLDPGNSDAWQNKAGLLAKTNKLDEAIVSYTKAIELNPAQPVFLYNRGCAYSRKGDKTNALADLAKAISMNPQFRSYVQNDEDFKSLWEDPDFKKIISQ